MCEIQLYVCEMIYMELRLRGVYRLFIDYMIDVSRRRESIWREHLGSEVCICLCLIYCI